MELKAAPRQPLGKRSRRLAREGKVPAIVYGYNTEPTPVTLDRLEFQKVFVKSGRTHLVDLVMDGHTEKVLIREIQTHPRRHGAIHVDFYQPNLQEKIEVEIPVHVVGESEPVKQGDGDVLQPMHSVRVECLPTEIPEAFEVDITPLEEIGAELRVSDLKVGAGVKVLDDPQDLVVKIVPKREMKIEEEIPAAEAAVPAEGEVAEAGEAPAAEEAAEKEE
jgi:large subunit ribosomal protein L25